MPSIKKQDIINIIEANGLNYTVLSNRLFRVKTREVKTNDPFDAFVELCGNKIAFNSYIIGGLDDLDRELKNIAAPPKKKTRKAKTDNFTETK